VRALHSLVLDQLRDSIRILSNEQSPVGIKLSPLDVTHSPPQLLQLGALLLELIPELIVPDCSALFS
jgi:hypothetical protein